MDEPLRNLAGQIIPSNKRLKKFAIVRYDRNLECKITYVTAYNKAEAKRIYRFNQKEED